MFPVGGFSGTMFLRARWVGSGTGCGVEVLACVFVFREGETAGLVKKYRTNQGWLQSSKLQNLNVKMISGEMNGTEMKWSVGGAKRNR